MSKHAKFSALLASLGMTSVLSSSAALSAAASEDGGEVIDTVTVENAEKVADAALEKGKAEGQAAGRAEGFKAAQDRMVAVLGSDAGKSNPAAAVALLKGAPDMSAEDAIATLAAMAPAAAAPAGGAAAVGADLNQTPKVEPGASANGGGTSDEPDGLAIWASVQASKSGTRASVQKAH